MELSAALGASRRQVGQVTTPWAHAVVNQPVIRRRLRDCRTVISYRPMFLPLILRLTPRGVSRRIDERTDVVIEGFPRSGNTFAAAALRQANGHSLRVASHVHTPSQIVVAVRRSLPTLVVVRRPDHSVRSLLAAAPHVRPGTAIKEWIAHYRHIWPYRDRFVVADFSQVIDDFGMVTKRLNHRFGTALALFEDSPAARREVDELMAAEHERYHQSEPSSAPWPVPGRGTIDDLARLRRDHHALIAEAERWYGRYRQLTQ